MQNFSLNCEILSQNFKYLGNTVSEYKKDHHHHHHHMALQPNTGPGLPFWGFVTITFLQGCIVSPAPNPPTWRTRPLHLWPPETGSRSYIPRHWVPILVAFCDMHGLQWDYSLIPATTWEIQERYGIQIHHHRHQFKSPTWALAFLRSFYQLKYRFIASSDFMTRVFSRVGLPAPHPRPAILEGRCFLSGLSPLAD
jgi:hypothetical protein